MTWISCADRLPKDGEKVIVKGPTKLGPAPGIICGQTQWYVRGKYYVFNMVSHWRLPEPPPPARAESEA